MRYPRYQNTVLAMGLIVSACGPRDPKPLMLDGPPADLKGSAASLYRHYGAAIAAARRGSLAAFYHHEGALVVLNGVARRQSREELNRKYTETWRPPTYFAWEDLAFDSLSPSQVLVTGGFQWQTSGQPDTTRFIYAAVLVAVDSGMVIVFEHETRRPAQ